MDDKTRQTIQQLNQDPATVQRLLTSQDGRKLVEMMSKANGGASLQQATMNAMRGDSGQLSQMINQLMQSSEGAALVDRINQAIKK